MTRSIEHTLCANRMDEQRREDFIRRHGFELIAAHAAGEAARMRRAWEAQRKAIMARSAQQVRRMEQDRGLLRAQQDQEEDGWLDVARALPAHIQERFGRELAMRRGLKEAAQRLRERGPQIVKERRLREQEEERGRREAKNG